MHEHYFEAAIADEVRKVVEARRGARNTQLNSAAFSLASLGIPEQRISASPNKRTDTPAKPQAPPSSQSRRTLQIPPGTIPDKDGKPKFIIAGDEGPPCWDNEIRRHVYRRDGVPVRIKVKYRDQASGKASWANWYRVHSSNTLGWQAGKPECYRDVPYVTFGSNPFDPEAQGDDLYWTEGEKDADAITNSGELALTFGGTGDGLTDDVKAVVAEYVSGRDVVIPADNDQGGRDHAQCKAAIAHPVALSVKIIEFPELPEHGDVSDWIAQGHTAEELRPAWTQHRCGHHLRQRRVPRRVRERLPRRRRRNPQNRRKHRVHLRQANQNGRTSIRAASLLQHVPTPVSQSRRSVSIANTTLFTTASLSVAT
jgi:hypothetical protein